jgi:glycosyltransferase involved in cell wall biosynthesis
VSRVVAIIPLYNHGNTVIEVVQGAQAAGLEVLVVDDGSTDGGDSHVQAFFDRNGGGWLVRGGRNQGKAHALLAGMREAQASGASHVLTMDADGQHDCAAIPRFLECVDEELTLVLGDRRPIPRTYPLARLCGRTLSSLAVRAACGQSVGDAACGMRVYPVSVTMRLGCISGRYAWEEEAIIRLAWRGVRVRQVVIPVIYRSASVARSHYRFLRDWPEGIAVLALCVIIRALGLGGRWSAHHDTKRQIWWPLLRTHSMLEPLLLACFAAGLGAVLTALAGLSGLGLLPVIAAATAVLAVALRTGSPIGAAVLGISVGHFAAPYWTLAVVASAAAVGIAGIARQRGLLCGAGTPERLDLGTQPAEKLQV